VNGVDPYKQVLSKTINYHFDIHFQIQNQLWANTHKYSKTILKTGSDFDLEKSEKSK
jgi:hypothetical protein